MADLGYGKDYRYDHDDANAYAPQDYFPENLVGREYYRPTDRGYEAQVQALMDWWRELRETRTRSSETGEPGS